MKIIGGQAHKRGVLLLSLVVAMAAAPVSVLAADRMVLEEYFNATR